MGSGAFGRGNDRRCGSSLSTGSTSCTSMVQRGQPDGAVSGYTTSIGNTIPEPMLLRLERSETKRHEASWWRTAGLVGLKSFSDGGRCGTVAGAGSVLFGLWNQELRQNSPAWVPVLEDQPGVVE